MATSDGQDDFILSRDRYNNTCLHYVALFDDENFIISLIKMLDKVDKDFPFKLKHLAEVKNKEGRTALDFFNRGKQDSYSTLH